MKKHIVLIPAVTAALMLASCGGSSVKNEEGQTAATASEAAKTFQVDPAASSINWLAKKVTGQHNGTTTIKTGELKVENGIITAGKLVVDMNSIVVEDLKEAEYNTKLVNHLKSDDFFSVEKNPESTFEIVSVEPIAGATAGTPNYTVKGNLTIKGITKSITFPATITQDGEKLKAAAQFDIDRTEWDIRYGSGKFFQDIGDKAIYDNFTLTLSITAKG